MKSNSYGVSSLRSLDSPEVGRRFLDCEICDPPNPPRVGVGYSEDWLRRLGDRIAALTPNEANELREYIEERRIV